MISGISSRNATIKRINYIRLFGFVMTIAALVLIVLKVENMLISSLLALLISYSIAPLVKIFERSGFQRGWAVALIFLFASAIGVLGLVALSPFVVQQLEILNLELPKYIQGLSLLIAQFETTIGRVTGRFVQFDLSEYLQQSLLPWTQAFLEGLPRIVGKALTVAVLAPFLAFFLIKDGRLISRGLLALVPNTLFEPTLNLFHQINDQMGYFIRARLFEALVVGVVTWVGLTIIQFPFATFLSLFAALTNLIPYVGPVVGFLPAMAIALVNGYNTIDTTLMIGVYLAAQIIDAALLVPFVLARIVDLHPVTVIVSIIIGGQVMGVVGMLISIPLASVLKVTLGTIYRLMAPTVDVPKWQG